MPTFILGMTDLVKATAHASGSQVSSTALVASNVKLCPPLDLVATEG